MTILVTSCSKQEVEQVAAPTSSFKMEVSEIEDIEVSQSLVNIMENLQVDFQKLGAELKLADLTLATFDFSNLYVGKMEGKDDELLIVNPEITDNRNTVKYSLIFIKDTDDFLKPFLVVTKVEKEILIVSLENERIVRIINQDYFPNVEIYEVDFRERIGVNMRSCGQDVADCIASVYSNKGWLSVWAVVQTAFIPATAVAIAADCTVHNCF